MPRLFGKREQNEPAPPGPRRLGQVSPGARVGAAEGNPADGKRKAEGPRDGAKRGRLGPRPRANEKGRLGPPRRTMRLGGGDGPVTLRGAGKPAARGLRPVGGKAEASDAGKRGRPRKREDRAASLRGEGRPGAPARVPERPRGLRPVKPPPPPPAESSHRLKPPSRALTAPPVEAPRGPGPLRRLARRVPWGRVAAAAAAAVIVVVLVAAYTNLARQPHLSASDVRQLAFQAMASATPPPPRASLIYAAVAPSVVQIVTDQAPNAESGTPDGAQEHAGGTGVILDQSAHILTALHVVQDATKIQVGFADGTVSDAEVISTEPEKDIAVLGVARPPAEFVPATLGDPNGLRVGEPAIVIGNPFGLAYTTTSGIISGLNRSFKAPKTGQEMTGLIQFDAAVNPGNSGGPLVNNNGEVVGIVTALANPTDQSVFIGIGFAVPIDTAANAAGSPPF